MTDTGAAEDPNAPEWRQRAVARSLNAARSRAEQRIQRFLDAAFALMDEKGTTEFTIQEVIDRSKQSMRGFYQYFDGKDELLLALFEETIREASDDLDTVVASHSDPMDRLRALRHPVARVVPTAVTHRASAARTTGARSTKFSVHLTVTHPDRVQAAMAPIYRMLVDLLDAAVAVGAIEVKDTRHAAALMQQTVMYSWLGNRLATNARRQVTAEETWEFCLHGLPRLDPIEIEHSDRVAAQHLVELLVGQARGHALDLLAHERPCRIGVGVVGLEADVVLADRIDRCHAVHVVREAPEDRGRGSR